LYHPWFDVIGKIIFALLAFVLIGKIPGKKDWDNYILRLDRIPKAVDGCKKIIDYVGEYFNLGVDYCKILFLGKKKEDLARAKGTYQEIKDWAAEVRKYMILHEREKIDTDVQTANYVSGLYLTGLRYQADTNLERDVKALVTAAMVPAKFLYEYATRSPVQGGGARMPPICLWLVGESGVGKSQITYPICIEMLKAMGVLKKDYANSIYARQVETKYFSGYCNQPIITYDDFGQLKDNAASPNPEFFEFIRFANNQQQHLNMASISEKNTYCRAKFALLTSNRYRLQCESLTWMSALYNRLCKYMYRVEVKPEFGKKMINDEGTEYIGIDRSKLSKDQAIDLSVYRFVRLQRDPSAEGEFVETGEVLEYEELIAYMVAEYKAEEKRFTEVSDFLDKKVDQYIKEQNQTKIVAEGSFDEAQKFKVPKYSREQIQGIIASRLTQNKTLDEIEYELLTQDEEMWEAFNLYKHEFSQDRFTKWANLIDKYLLKVACKIDDWIEEGTKFIRENPMFVALGLIGLVLSGIALYQFFTSDDNFEDEEEETVEVKSKPIIRKTKKNKAEVGNSGDAKTNKMKKVKVEVGNSGDQKTIKSKQVRVEVGNSGDAKTTKTQKVTVEVAKQEESKALHDTAVCEGVTDKVAHNLVIDLFRSNTYRLSYKIDGKRSQIGNCTFVKGWTMIMPLHFLRTLEAKRLPLDTEILFSQDNNLDIMRVPLDHFIAEYDEDELILTSQCAQLRYKNGDERDCVMVNLHKAMCVPHRDLIKHFVKIGDQGKLRSKYSGVLSTYHANKEDLTRSYLWLQGIKSCDREIEIFMPDGDSSYHQRDCYEYNAPTIAGDCGSIVCIYNNYLERKVVGMHIAGSNSGIGFATPLTQELLNEGIESLISANPENITAHFCYEPPKCVDTLTDCVVPEGKFVGLGKSSIRVGQATRSSLQKSRIYGLLSTPITTPALLKPTKINGEVVDPLMKGLKKCGIDTAVFKNEDLKSACMDVKQTVFTQYNENLDKKKYERFLTYEEAIRGTGDDEYMSAINRTTSPGFPYCNEEKTAPGKQHWMGSGVDFDFKSKAALRLRKDVEDLEEKAKNGIISDVVFVDTLKDERRPIAKVEAGKTRVFSAGPQHFVIAVRKRFLPFVAWLMHNRIDNEIAVGTNPYSLDWDKLAKKLLEKGPHIIAGDFGNFDGSLVAQVLWYIFWEIVMPWMRRCEGYNQDEEKILIALWASLVHSVHIFGDNVYMWTHSQPSGNPLTVIINCFYNAVIMRLMWILIMRERNPALMSMKHFRRCVSFVSYGDDNCVNINKDAIKFYNQVTISEMMAKYMHEYTDEAKTGELVEYRTLEDIEFLKRSFRKSKELMRYVAPLRKEVIYEMLNWTRNGLNSDEILMTNIDTAFREIVLHGREEYKILRNKIENLTVLPAEPQILTYEQYLHDVEFGADALYDF